MKKNLIWESKHWHLHVWKKGEIIVFDWEWNILQFWFKQLMVWKQQDSTVLVLAFNLSKPLPALTLNGMHGIWWHNLTSCSAKALLASWQIGFKYVLVLQKHCHILYYVKAHTMALERFRKPFRKGFHFQNCHRRFLKGEQV